ncbi:MAG: phosphoadenylyl-sulfate reductase [Rhodospirillaceae bacterium]|nr:phosphoadenylyl-sulfate reductase [Rhodospirillaceae bacterium]
MSSVAARVVEPINLASHVELLNNRYADASPSEVLRAMIQDEFPGKVALVSSFGTESAALLHMISQIDKAAPVVFLDTGKLFGETKRYRDQLIKLLGLSGVQSVTPDVAALAARDPKGVLWSQNPDACCALRKVEPLERALRPYDAWFTGRKAFQAASRAGLPLFEIENGRIKINPIVRWTKADIEAYFTAHDLPRHPLEADGYLSIGCMPCTSRVEAGEDARAGRWRGSDKIECGIHLPAGQTPARAEP